MISTGLRVHQEFGTYIYIQFKREQHVLWSALNHFPLPKCEKCLYIESRMGTKWLDVNQPIRSFVRFLITNHVTGRGNGNDLKRFQSRHSMLLSDQGLWIAFIETRGFFCGQIQMGEEDFFWRYHTKQFKANAIPAVFLRCCVSHVPMQWALAKNALFQ